MYPKSKALDSNLSPDPDTTGAVLDATMANSAFVISNRITLFWNKKNTSRSVKRSRYGGAQNLRSFHVTLVPLNGI
jgi:hypothetical protein